MCVGGGHKSKISVFDKLKQDLAKKQAAKDAPITAAPGGAGAPTVATPGGTAKPVTPGTVIAGPQGNTAATGVYGERRGEIYGEGGVVNPLFGGILNTLLKITGQTSKTTTDQNAVGAGRIGRAYGASDLRIGR